MKILLFSLALLIFLGGCSTRKGVSSSSQWDKGKNTWITSSLLKEYAKWDDTPYKHGGETLRGVDCSAFIQNVYSDAFGIRLPRTTREQVKKGYLVRRSSIREGDLIFFKTGYNVRHAGIAMKNDKFLHTSTKYGVTISSLNNPYWKNKYWQTRRVLP